MHHRKFVLAIAVTTASFGCAGNKPVDIGENDSAKTGERLADYAASWDGFVEAFDFPSGSDRIRLTLDADGNGTLEAGEDVDYGTPQAGVAFAPPQVLYGEAPFRTLREGFKYTVRAASVEAKRLEFGVDGHEVYTPWCAVQTPYPETVPPPSPFPELVVLQNDPPGTYVCLDGAPTGESLAFGQPGGMCNTQDASGNQTPADCTFIQYCAFTGAPCTCTATACSVVPETSNFETRVDGALDDPGTFTGTFVFIDSVAGNQRLTIHLTRH